MKANSVKIIGDQIAQLHSCFSTQEQAEQYHIQRRKVGYLDSVLTEHLTEHSLIKYHKNIFSQVGQDGIIEEIFSRLQIQKGTFIEFGGWDGVYLSNCRYLALQGWKGMFIEADTQKYKELCDNYKDNDSIICENRFVDFIGENSIDEIVRLHDIKEVDLLCIDIDGLDYKIMEAMAIRPKVILLEGGLYLSPYLTARIPDEIAKNNISQPLPVLLSIASKLNYSVVCFLQDVYLVRSDLAGSFYRYNELPVELYRDWYFCINDYNRNYLINYMRNPNQNPAIKAIEEMYFESFQADPLGYTGAMQTKESINTTVEIGNETSDIRDSLLTNIELLIKGAKYTEALNLINECEKIGFTNMTLLLLKSKAYSGQFK